jgi:hypothetical protein
MTLLAPNTKPTPTAPKPGKEEVRQMVVADQAAALKDAASSRANPAKPDKAKAKTKAKPEKAADARKITVLAKSNPHAAGSRRAGWFKQLKTGMTVEDAVKSGVRSVYLTRMAAREIIKLG